MSIKLDEKNDVLNHEMDFPDDVEQLNQMMQSLYEKISQLEGKISDRSEDLTDFFQDNIKQNRVSYIREDDEIYLKAQKVDNLVNEYNNACIRIELIEKKIKKLTDEENS